MTNVFLQLFSVLFETDNKRNISSTMILTKSVSTVTVYLLGIFLVIRNQVVHADNAANWTVEWQYKDDCGKPSACPLKISMDQSAIIIVTISNLDHPSSSANQTVRVVSDSDIFQVPNEISVSKNGTKRWRGEIKANAIFIGKANLHIEIVNGVKVEQSDSMPVIIIRDVRLIDTLFIISVASLVSILYINFGAALDFQKVKSVLWRPVGPAIAFGCHFLFLPLVSHTFTFLNLNDSKSGKLKYISIVLLQASYGLGLLLFPNDPALQLGLFFTGVSPAGGASNTWTVILGGNIDLSITMSTTSTLASFGELQFQLLKRQF